MLYLNLLLFLYRIIYTTISITTIDITIITITTLKILHFHIKNILPQLINNLFLIFDLILQRQYIRPQQQHLTL
mgnify:CR=1 FL=1